ncbi:MAG: hypothetical protein EA362_05485 [Saprospirales bacterium]|nr:MAG: hypothetical protein EA362_05485 [Saprospirales bacterium]
MQSFQKSVVLVLMQLLLLSQIHLSVYAIHCLCTGEVHLSLSAEKECTAEECNSLMSDCCASGESCSADDHLVTSKDGSCHAPKATIDIGLDLEATISVASETQSEIRSSDVPLFLLFTQLKIPHSCESAHTVEAPLGIENPPGFRYIVFGEMLC